MWIEGIRSQRVHDADLLLSIRNEFTASIRPSCQSIEQDDALDFKDLPDQGNDDIPASIVSVEKMPQSTSLVVTLKRLAA